MAISRKDALKRLNGLRKVVEEHIEALAIEPECDAAQHWKGELREWLSRMRDALPHVGRKTAETWSLLIDAWQQKIEEHDNADDRND